MIKLCLIFLCVGVIAFLLAFKASLKTRLLIAFLCSVVPLAISFIIIFYSGDKAAEDAVEYKGPEESIVEMGNSDNYQREK